MRRLRALPWKKIVLFGLPGSLLVLLVLFGVGYATTSVPSPSKLSTQQATLIRYAGGEELARLGTNRTLVPLSDVSEPAQKAVLAAEDRGFYTEPGISPKGIVRALFTNVRGGGSVQQGGSTITQQYAKNAFLSSDRTYTRKVKEVFISLKMTRQRSKEQILEDYLNTIYFGRGAYGIEAASRAYFGTSAKDLTTAQGAVLASSIRSPAGYDPTRHPQASRERFAYVLDGMAQQGWITAADRAAAKYPKVKAPRSQSGADLSGPTGHVVDAVQDELNARGFQSDELTKGGLEVTTTLKKDDQEAAVQAVEKVNHGDKGNKALQGALVSVVPGDGAVVAYYGGANGSGLDFAGGIVHAAGDPVGVTKQPGSSFKPYVLAAALKQGIPLTHQLDGNSPKTLPDGTVIHNFGDESLGSVSAVTATEESVNTAYFELGLEVGPKKVAQLAHDAGIPEDVPLAEKDGTVVGGISLGVYAVHVSDQAAGYATFAAGGEAAAPYLVKKVVRDGKDVYTARPETSRAFSEDVAADATYAMQQVVQAGTGTAAQLAGGRETAGKTGTTTDNKDVWFNGFTPQLATSVWFGYGTGRTIKIDGVNEATGGRISAGVFKEYMDSALQGEPDKTFPPRAYVGSGGGGGGGGGISTGVPAPVVTPAPTYYHTRSPRPYYTPPATSRPTRTSVPTTRPPTTPPRTSSASPRPTLPLPTTTQSRTKSPRPPARGPQG